MGLGCGGHSGGGRGSEGCGGPPRSSRPQCGAGAGCWGGRGALPVAMAMVHAWSAASAMWYPPIRSRRASVRGPEMLGWLAGGGGGWGHWPRAVVGVEGQWVRSCPSPKQTQWSGLQGRAVCGSRWHTQRGHAVAGGWRYLWTDGGGGAIGLVARAWRRMCVPRLWCSCVPC